MSEWLDIVDENDVVVGRAPREQIHREQLWHRSAHVLLFNTQGQVFVQLRSRSKDVGAGLWDTSAAGHVDSGESYQACAVRELNEELGVSVAEDALSILGSLRPAQRNGFEFTRIYSVCSDQVLSLQAEEIDDGRWLAPSELDAWMMRQSSDFTEVFRVIWSMYRHTE